MNRCTSLFCFDYEKCLWVWECEGETTYNEELINRGIDTESTTAVAFFELGQLCEGEVDQGEVDKRFCSGWDNMKVGTLSWKLLNLAPHFPLHRPHQPSTASLWANFLLNAEEGKTQHKRRCEQNNTHFIYFINWWCCGKQQALPSPSLQFTLQEPDQVFQ